MSKNLVREVIAPSYSYMWESASLDDPGQSDEDSMETSKKKKKAQLIGQRCRHEKINTILG